MLFNELMLGMLKSLHIFTLSDGSYIQLKSSTLGTTQAILFEYNSLIYKHKI